MGSSSTNSARRWRTQERSGWKRTARNLPDEREKASESHDIPAVWMVARREWVSGPGRKVGTERDPRDRKQGVHENYVSKEDAWNQYNYMEDVLRIVADHHANRRKQRGPAVKKSQTGCHGASVKKTSVAQMKGRGQGQSKSGGQSQAGKSQAKNSGQGHVRSVKAESRPVAGTRGRTQR